MKDSVEKPENDRPNLSLLDRFCRLARHSLSATSAAIYRDCAELGWQRQYCSPPHLCWDDGIDLKALSGGDGVIAINNINADARIDIHGNDESSEKVYFIAIAPIYLNSATVAYGHLVVADSKPRRLSADEEGSLQEFSAMAGDLIDMRNARRRAAAAERELATERQQRESLIRSLSQSNQQLEQFAYIASHDLQEPLRMVTGFLGLLQDEYGQQLGDEADEYIEFATDGARRMKSMINGLLSYSRVGASDEPFVTVDAEQIFIEVRDQLINNHPNVDATITHDALPTIQGREDQIRRLFSNLINNAIDHSETASTIHIGVEEKADEFLFSVTDQGVGIAEAQQERIFDLFVSGKSRATEPHTGIGLTICTAIVEQHGGRLWVESAPDEGAAFYFTISKRNSQ